MFKTRKGLLLIIAFLFFSGWIKVDTIKNIFSKPAKTASQTSRQIRISPLRETHILYGDSRGGGHLYGVGKPCKSEFPKEWSKADVISHVKEIAANDNLNWEEQDNGYYVAQENIDGVRMRVVLDKERDDVITAYPVGGTRNSCITKRPANDNYNP